MDSTEARRLRRLPRITVAGTEVPIAVGRWARLLGLAGLDRSRAGVGLLIPNCHSVHTFGMRFDLDIAFIDDAGRVVATHRGVEPGRVLSDRGAVAVLEIPATGRRLSGDRRFRRARRRARSGSRPGS